MTSLLCFIVFILDDQRPNDIPTKNGIY